MNPQADPYAILAQAEADCLSSYPNPAPEVLLEVRNLRHLPECICHGTGKVARIPGLRRPCNRRIIADFGAGDPNFPDACGERHPDNCTRCTNLEYIVLHGAEAEMVLREWLPENGYFWSLQQVRKHILVATVWAENDTEISAISEEEDALAQATVKMLDLEVKE